MVFASREDAGQKLGYYLKDKSIHSDLVLGLPRGGVIVAAGVAHILQSHLDVLIVRKIGHPLHREFAVGALAEGDVVLLDDRGIVQNFLIKSQLNQIIEEEKARLQAYQQRFRHEPLELAGKSVILVDDGLATGATTEAAVLSAKKQNANKVMVAAPVGSTHAMERLGKVADEVHAIVVDPEFDAVGRYYDVFTQTTDEEVLDLLHAETKRHD